MREAAIGLAAIGLAAVALSALALGGAAGAAKKPPASYPLGKAKHCRAHYVKRTRRHKVKGKLVRYIACVYDAPKPKPKPVPTTTQPAAVATHLALTVVPSGLSPTSTYDVTVTPIITGAGFTSPATGTLSATVTDTITGQKVGTWVNTGGYGAAASQPPLDLAVSIAQPPTISVDSSLGAYWSGPSLQPISLADLDAHALAVTVTFSGMPGFAGSSATMAVPALSS